jgi:pimeloyl-ACP methyl ester carboxylesterase
MPEHFLPSRRLISQTIKRTSQLTEISAQKNMNIPFALSRALVLFVLISIVSVSAQPAPKSQSDPAMAELGQGFVSGTAIVNGTTLHYVRGGTGPAVILLHGFPENWYEFHKVMPRLAKKFTVIAVDLRGIGDSTAVSGGYEAANMAEDIHQLAQELNLERVYIAGHDLGGMVAYAFARRYPQDTRGVMILDAPIPGIKGWDEIQGDPSVWHVRFMQVPGLPEKLVAGRQADYLGYFFSFGKFTPGDVAHYSETYATAPQLHAAFEMFRAFPANAQFNAAQIRPNEVPVFLAAGDGSPFAKLVPKMAEGLRANGCTQVETGVIQGSVHYVVDDQPQAVAKLIEDHASLN